MVKDIAKLNKKRDLKNEGICDNSSWGETA
jgi:hypothetical protein